MTRILVVDDSRSIRNAASKMLGHEFDVVTAEDGEDGWSQIEDDPSIQVVFTDLAMPGLNGYELVRNVRTAADPGIRNLPVIVVTGADDDEVARVRSLELGATDFITKPFTSIDLLARARAHANYQRITRELRAQTTLDSLTGLANKAGFLDRLQQDMAYARRHHQELTLVRIELDDFRTIFLKHGKELAERLLLHVARLLRATIRKEDTASRIGLGGFALSLPGGQAHGIEGMLGRLRADVAKQWVDADGNPLPLGLSTALLSPDLTTPISAQEALDQCQAKLATVFGTAAASAPTVVAAPTRPQTPLAPAASVPAAPAPTTSGQAPTPMRLDPILDQIDGGNPQAAIADMPKIVRRLVPLLRLLSAAQRSQLIGFLQQLRN